MALTVDTLHTDGTRMQATSIYNGPGTTGLRVLVPPFPHAGRAPRIFLVVPVKPDDDDSFGDGLNALAAYGFHDQYNLVLVAPEFHVEPWLVDNPGDTNQRYESFVVDDLLPWVRANVVDAPSWALSFSKGGWSTLSLLMRRPSLFNLAGAWDVPATKTAVAAQVPGGDWSAITFGTEANYDSNYDLISHLAARAAPFQSAERMWLSGDISIYHAETEDLHEAMGLASIQHQYITGATRAHRWDSGWIPGAVFGLLEMFGARFVASVFVGDENPLSEDGVWDTPGTWNAMQKSDGAQATDQANCCARRVTPAIDDDQYAEIVFDQDPGASSWVGVTTRMQGSGSDACYLSIAYDGSVRLYRTGAGLSFTLLATASVDVSAAPRRLRLESEGSTHRVYFNDVLLLDETDATYVSGQPGVAASEFGGPSVTATLWEAGDLTAAGAVRGLVGAGGGLVGLPRGLVG